jgi:hypothetical protein
MKHIQIENQAAAVALIEAIEQIRDHGTPEHQGPYPAGPQRDKINIQIEELKTKFKI